MSDPAGAPTPPPPPVHPPPAPDNRGLGWFFVVSGTVVLLLSLGCILVVSSDDAFLGFVCGSPTLILGGVFLWLGSRRLKR